MDDNLKSSKSLIVALYARVSTGHQEQEETIGSQIDEIKLRIASDGNILPSENVFMDDGWSGSLMQRPGLDAMRDTAIAGKFQVLYVYDRGRLSRIFAHQEIIIEELLDRGINFVTLHDIEAITDEGRVMQAMQGVFHEYERVKIAERFRRGKLFKAKSGILINGNALYGWSYIKKTDFIPAHYEIAEEEAEVVRMIFRWVGVDGLSLREVIRRLYNLHIYPRKRKREFWTKGPIIRILRNEAYVKGVVYYNKTEAVVAMHPIKNGKYKKVKKTSRRERPVESWLPFKVSPILSNDGTFEKVQQILADNQRYASKNRKYDYLLTGKVYCGCGSRRVGDGYSKGSNHYYRCSQRIYKFPMAATCKIPGVNAVVFDGLFWKELTKFLADSKQLREQTEDFLIQSNKMTSEDSEREDRFNVQLEKLQEEEIRYAKAYGEGALDFEQFKTLVNEVRQKKVVIEAQKKELKAVNGEQKVDKIQVEELCEEAQKVLKSLDLSNKKLIIRDIISKVIIKEEGEVEVRGQLALSNQNMGYEPISRDCGTAECGEVDSV